MVLGLWLFQEIGETVPSVAIVGTRGYPSFYGGFETAVRKLAPYLADNGWDVTVYGRNRAIGQNGTPIDSRVTTIVTPGIETQKLSTLSYGLTSVSHAAYRNPDVVLMMNVANGYYLPILKTRNIPTLVNVDGIEWERAKWSPFAKRVFHYGAKCTARWASELVFDAKAIERYWQDTFGASGVFIPYGGEVPPTFSVPQGQTHRGYVLIVARFVPENSVPEFLEAVPLIAATYPVVIVGSSGYGGELDNTARDLANTIPSVTWFGHVSDDSLLLALWQHAGVYFHGHSVGGTNPALVQAMAAGAPVVARDTVFNREVLGSEGTYVGAQAAAITAAVGELMSDRDALERASQANVLRAKMFYSWENVCQKYERTLENLVRRAHDAG